MKEDVVAANLANLRQSINELKECIPILLLALYQMSSNFAHSTIISKS